ncbi:MAG: ABC transporter permease [Planctomycetaceae bacterium]
MLRFGILNADFDLMSRTIPTVTQAIPIRELSKASRHRDREITARIVGCTPEYLDINHLDLAQGRLIRTTTVAPKRTLRFWHPARLTNCFSMKTPSGSP